MAQKNDWKLRFGERLDLKREFAGCREEVQLDETGRRRRVMVYYGDYYRFNYTGGELRRIRIRCAGLSIAGLLCYVALALFIPFSGNPFVLAAELLTVIPCYYLCRGLWALCRAKEPFEQKVPLMSVRRMKSSSHGILALLALTMAGEGIVLWVTRPQVKLWSELLFFLLPAAAIACLLVLLRQLKTFHLEVVRKGRSTLEREKKEETNAPQT